MALAHCILDKFILGVGCHYSPLPLDVPTFIARCLHVHNNARDPSSERWNCGREMLSGNFAKMTTFTPFRDLLHAANLWHGTDGFASPPKEGVLRIFSPLKIPWLWPGLNPQTWVLKAPRPPKLHTVYVGNYLPTYQYDLSVTSSREDVRISYLRRLIMLSFAAR